MIRSAEKRGKDETVAATKKVGATGKPASGAHGGITAPVTPSAELAKSSAPKTCLAARLSRPCSRGSPD